MINLCHTEGVGQIEVFFFNECTSGMYIYFTHKLITAGIVFFVVLKRSYLKRGEKIAVLQGIEGKEKVPRKKKGCSTNNEEP